MAHEVVIKEKAHPSRQRQEDIVDEEFIAQHGKPIRRHPRWGPVMRGKRGGIYVVRNGRRCYGRY